jgi:uncharacterized metal-binding protein YceD (DUF177 family)
MIIDLNSFGRESTYDVLISADEIDLEIDNQRIADDVAFHATVTKGAAATTVTGQIKGSLELDCDRCLEPVKTPIDVSVDLEFVPVEQFSADSEKELTAADLNVDAFDGESLDLKAIAREQILLEVPQQFFCREDCKGLCVKCGGNLNLIDCNCNETEIDPRWAALGDLRF